MYIGKFSEAAGISIRTLYHYEEIGLVPKAKRQGNYRTYGQKDLDRIDFILRAKTLGFSLKEISEFVHIHDETEVKLCQASLQFIRDKVDSITQQKTALEQRLKLLMSIEKNILTVIEIKKA